MIECREYYIKQQRMDCFMIVVTAKESVKWYNYHVDPMFL